MDPDVSTIAKLCKLIHINILIYFYVSGLLCQNDLIWFLDNSIYFVCSLHLTKIKHLSPCLIIAHLNVYHIFILYWKLNTKFILRKITFDINFL